ncbi:Vi polysaccharide biosynthesis UDP-N-acetylglucosamine C-6 dehydrogenase TviB, partial [Bordetella bronchiseptica]
MAPVPARGVLQRYKHVQTTYNSVAVTRLIGRFILRIDDVKLAVVGLGYVGLPLAVEFGKKRPVIGFDINERRIAA